jgi:hypothetical protein
MSPTHPSPTLTWNVLTLLRSLKSKTPNTPHWHQRSLVTIFTVCPKRFETNAQSQTESTALEEASAAKVRALAAFGHSNHLVVLFILSFQLYHRCTHQTTVHSGIDGKGRCLCRRRQLPRLTDIRAEGLARACTSHAASSLSCACLTSTQHQQAIYSRASSAMTTGE